MEIGTVVITLVDKPVYDQIKETETVIKKGTVGLICELYDDYAEVEIWGEGVPEGAWGVYGFYLSEITEHRLLLKKQGNDLS